MLTRAMPSTDVGFSSERFAPYPRDPHAYRHSFLRDRFSSFLVAMAAKEGIIRKKGSLSIWLRVPPSCSFGAYLNSMVI
eukprot:scaffold24550_cov60-Cyclotella_meneghiniana.AAC.16